MQHVYSHSCFLAVCLCNVNQYYFLLLCVGGIGGLQNMMKQFQGAGGGNFPGMGGGARGGGGGGGQ